jgi:lipopolysaccharide export system permease protein
MKASSMCGAACLSLTLLIFLSTIFGKLSVFSQHNAPEALIAQYLFFSVPQMIFYVLPFSICIGIIATQAQFSRHLETIAMQSCSVSFLRLSLPYICVGLVAVFIMSILSFSVYPIAQQKADKINNVYIRKHDVTGSFSVNGGRFKVGNDVYYVEHLDILKGIMRNVSCYRTKSGKLYSILRCDSAVWDGKEWNTGKLDTIMMSTSGISFTQSASSLPLKHDPADLGMAEPNPEVLSLMQLMQYREHLKEDGIRSVSLETQFHSRISFTMAPLIMTMLVLPFGLRFPRAGGIARGISIGITLGLFYWALHSVMINAGGSGYINPALAAWSTEIVMLSTSMIFMMKRRKTYG